MSQEPSEGERAPEDTQDTGETQDTPGSSQGRSQVPAHVPPHLQSLFTKHEGAVAARPGFRNPSNKKTKAQRKKRKK